MADRYSLERSQFISGANAVEPTIELLSTDLLDEYREIVNTFVELARSLNGLVIGWHYLLDLAWIAGQISDPAGLTVLDAGAGLGLLQWWLAERGARVISADRQPRKNINTIFQNRFRIGGLRLEDQPAKKPGVLSPSSGGEVLIYNTDLANLAAIETNSIDLVVSVSALEHNTPEGLKKGFAELERVLKPGARMLVTMAATKSTDWFHEASQGWCLTEDSLRNYFELPEVHSNFSQFDEIFSKLRNSTELRENLHPFYSSSGNNGMPWGVWDPKYQPVGIRKIKPMAASKTPDNRACSSSAIPKQTLPSVDTPEKALAGSNLLLSQFQDRHRGQRCIIIGNGPSLNKMDLSFLKDEITFGLNRIYLLSDQWNFSPTYFVSVNPLVIEQSADEILRIPAPKFLSLSGFPYVSDPSQAIFLKSLMSPCFSRDPRQGIWEGHTVTYVAMQLAYFMGFSEVILIGVDHNFIAPGRPDQEVVSQSSDLNHFAPNYFGKGVRWNLPNLKKSEIAYRVAKQVFESEGRSIYDATVEGKLTVFPKVDYRDIPAKKPLVPASQPSEPLVSAIVHSKGSLQSIQPALDSLVAQTHRNLEIIVVHDWDVNVRQVEDSIPRERRARFIPANPQRETAESYNIGLRSARGEYVVYLEEGQRFVPDHISLLKSWLQMEPDSSAGCTLSTQPDFDIRSFRLERVFVENLIPLSCIMHRRSALERAGLFNENLKLLASWDFLIRLILTGGFSLIPSATVDHLVGWRPALSSRSIAELEEVHRRYAGNLTAQIQDEQRKYLDACVSQSRIPGQRGPSHASFSARAIEIFEIIVNSNDVAGAIQQNRNRLDGELVDLIRFNAATARSEGNQELAEGLDALLEYIRDTLARGGS